MQALAVDLQAMGKRARTAAHRLATLSAEAKNEALASIAAGLESRQDEILAANESDCDRAGRDGMSAASLDRLVLNPARLEGIATDVRSVAALPDPVGEILESRELPNGLRVSRRRVPLGVIGAIYESRPNVTVDIAALCFKSGNAVILKGGSEALASNSVLASVVRDGIEASGAPVDAVQFVDSTDRSLVGEMLAMKEYIDLVVPRGGAELVRRVAAEAAMPAITGGIGVCHAYVDQGCRPRHGRIDRPQREGAAAPTSATRWTPCSSTPWLPRGSCRASPRRGPATVSRCVATAAP